MSRAALTYGDQRAARRFEGFDADTPVEGFYAMPLTFGGIRVGIRIWYGPPHDPWTGEEMDRSWRWQAETDGGEAIDIERVWPACARNPISEADFLARRDRSTWARKAAPDSAYADHRRRFDPLSTSTPLPF